MPLRGHVLAQLGHVYAFNSLFEMPQKQESHTDCEEWSFNSLFEMQLG